MAIQNFKRLAAVAFATLGLFASSAARADTGYEYYFLYYSDEAHTTLVGGEARYCDSSWIRWGDITLYNEYVEVRECPE
jgi:hypothetical protein